ncbi:hypothetical protein GQ55_3G068300 [Panicum hallii var. hallii]|uniref:Uncharacterized protein n=1 Tax=Panicum hallii var. hallii TaxID=1504633 RepID=A0A2T7E6I3_9POAL|nr:hypothetical protein GQ55_3G068300 [Panicum hallii var. hallii]
MSGLGHRRQPSVIPEDAAILQFEEVIMVDDTITESQKRSPKDDTPYVGTAKKVNNKSILGDVKGTNDKDGVKDLATQVKTTLEIKDI